MVAMGTPSAPLVAAVTAALALHTPLAVPRGILAEGAVANGAGGGARGQARGRRRERRRRGQQREAGASRLFQDTGARPAGTAALISSAHPIVSVGESGVGSGSNNRKRRRTACISKGWHVHLANEDGCTNDDNYPKEWTDNPTIMEVMFHATAEGCCARLRQMNGGGGCRIYEGSGCHLDPTAGAIDSKPLAGSKPSIPANAAPDEPECHWHPSTAGGTTCVYSSNYPSAWANPEWSHNFLFETHLECCQGGYEVKLCGQAMECEKEEPEEVYVPDDIPPPPPAEALDDEPANDGPASDESPADAPSGPKCHWHPSTAGGTTCIFSSDYPSAWSNPEWSHQFLFDSHLDCCRGGYEVAHCGKREECVTDEPTMSPVAKVITLGPTATPTSMPTSTYFIEHFTGVCLDEASNVRPHYTTATYNSIGECCQASFATEHCLANAAVHGDATPAPVPATWHPTYAPTHFVYYVEHFGGKCIYTSGAGVPHYVMANETYADHRECCEWSHRREECLREAPEADPTGMPTAWSTGAPTEAPAAVPSGMPSLPTARPTEDDCSGMRWRYDPDYVRGCTNLGVSDGGDAAVLFPSWQECCLAFFARGHDCRVDDRCATTPDTVAYEDRPPEVEGTCAWSYAYYHPDDEYRDGCTNSQVIPDSWMALEDRSGLFFGSALQCCQEVYLDKGYSCHVRNVCAAGTEPPTSPPTVSPCQVRSWHPDVDPNVDGCSNSVGDYPLDWDVEGGGMMFDTAEKCCDEHYVKYGLECNIRDTCPAEDSPDDSGTAEPTTVTTVGLTTTSTMPESPSCAAAKWHPSDDFSRCTNDLAYPPFWEDSSSLMFNSALACCENVFNYPNCPMVDVCPPSPSPESPPAPSPEPSTRPVATPAPIDESTTADAGLGDANENACNGMARRDCRSHDSCVWDRAEKSCVRAYSHCIGKRRKECRQDAECDWDASDGTCGKLGTSVHGDDCQSKLYHPRSANDFTCSNDDNYPKLWNEPNERAKYLFQSATECCEAFYEDPFCYVVNVCSTDAH